VVTETAALAEIRRIAASVPDPELPMLTLGDLGILRDVSGSDQRVIVSLTPTYSGCPALAEMRRDVAARLAAAGFADVEVRTVLSPPWSTDSISADGRRKLAAAGISPPRSRSAGPAADGAAGGDPRPQGSESPRTRAGGPVPLTLFTAGPPVACPQCGSADTVLTAAFSGTACKDLRRCRACGEPFEHVKEV
jgi:ring-1,2-phenylacetyl-CoA epoxidase subunit PaaD